jgi:hypothetical protein
MTADGAPETRFWSAADVRLCPRGIPRIVRAPTNFPACLWPVARRSSFFAPTADQAPMRRPPHTRTATGTSDTLDAVGQSLHRDRSARSEARLLSAAALASSAFLDAVFALWRSAADRFEAAPATALARRQAGAGERLREAPASRGRARGVRFRLRGDPPARQRRTIGSIRDASGGVAVYRRPRCASGIVPREAHPASRVPPGRARPRGASAQARSRHEPARAPPGTRFPRSQFQRRRRGSVEDPSSVCTSASSRASGGGARRRSSTAAGGRRAGSMTSCGLHLCLRIFGIGDTRVRRSVRRRLRGVVPSPRLRSSPSSPKPADPARPSRRAARTGRSRGPSPSYAARRGSGRG